MILIIGNSAHLIASIKSVEQGNIDIISWRSLDEYRLDDHVDKIYLVGYDYSSYCMDFYEFLSKNVVDPFNYVLKIKDIFQDASIIYINTLKPRHTFTFSRYLYAKQRLENELSRLNGSLCVRLPTIVDDHNAPVAEAGLISRYIFRFLKWAGVIKVVNEKNLGDFLKVRLEPCNYLDLKPIGLSMKRSKFLDRFMRLTLG